MSFPYPYFFDCSQFDPLRGQHDRSVRRGSPAKRHSRRQEEAGSGPARLSSGRVYEPSRPWQSLALEDYRARARLPPPSGPYAPPRQGPLTLSEKPIRNLFLFIGADPATDWLQGCGVALDGKRFVPTGENVPPDLRTNGMAGRPLPLETSVLGVFAVGDVRSGSVKRVGGAIGEGAAVVPQLHAALAQTATA
jgi:hypothetical protein